MPSGLKNALSGAALELAAVVGRVDDGEAAALVDALADHGRVFVAGAGRSGLLLRCAAMRLMHLDKRVYVVGEVVTPAMAAGDLLLVMSGSGETGSMVAMARKAGSLGADLAVLTANPDSTLAGLAKARVRVAAPIPGLELPGAVESRQPMANLFEQAALLLLDAVVAELMRRMGKTPEIMMKRHANLE